MSFQYDSRDNLYRMLDSIGTTTYNEYDVANRLKRFTDAQGFEVSYSYDSAGNLTILTYPGNKTVTYTYDELNRLETVTINWVVGTPVSTFYYDESGRLDQIDQFNGSKVYYGYDNADRLTDLENEKGNTTPIATYHFTLDNNGNRTHIAKNEPLTFDPSAQNMNYTYNTQKNRLLTAGADTFTHDDEGQLSAKNSTSYTFDYEHRLKTIGSTIQYFYDGMGKRIRAVRNGVTTRYIYDAKGNLLAEADINNVILRYYIYGNGLMAMVTSGGQVYCYHFNATGNTIAITDSSQNIVNKYAYTPFGEIGSEVEAFTQPFKYVGQYGVISESNGLYYMRARYYDPTLGRFISEDPLGLGGGDVNLYVYVNNNPVLLVDPLGLCAEPRSLAASTAYGIGYLTGTLDSPITQGAVNFFNKLVDYADEAEILLAVKGSVKLTRLHPDSSLSKASLTYWRKQDTSKIVESLAPNASQPLVVNNNGVIMNGNTRVKVLQERGYDINTLPY